MVALAPGPAATPIAVRQSAQIARQRICIVSDDLSGVADEGIKRYSVALAAALRADHEPIVISTTGPTAIPGVRVLPTGRTFLGSTLRLAIQQQRPDLIIYAARGSATFASFLRAAVLHRYYPSARIALLGLQTRQHRRYQRPIVRLLCPDLIGAGSQASADYLASLGCRVTVMPSGVDLDQFRPVDPDARRRLRVEHQFDHDRPLVLHVGHLETGRNIRHLATLASRGICQVALVTSSSTAFQAEADLGRELRGAGVRLITTYQPRIEEFYQLADCYLFPTVSTDNAIDTPLSVLEALACDTPVVSTPYGGLPGLFAGIDQSALHFSDTADDLIATTEKVACDGFRGGREFVARFGWGAIAAKLVAELQDGGG